MSREASQRLLVLYDLQAGRRITALDALNRHGIFRLSSIIHRLRKAGYDIRTDNVKAQSGANHAVYWMPKKKPKTGIIRTIVERIFEGL